MPILGLQAAVYRVGEPATSGAETSSNNLPIIKVRMMYLYMHH